jgi:hypothetical protein
VIKMPVLSSCLWQQEAGTASGHSHTSRCALPCCMWQAGNS